MVPKAKHNSSKLWFFILQKSDNSLFVQFTLVYTIFILIYVDDIIITGSSLHEIQKLISKLRLCFSLKDLDPLHYFLGVEVKHLPHGGLDLSQQKYITNLLHRTNMHATKPLPTPMQTNLRLQKDASHALHDPLQFRFVVDALQYIVITRPELSFAVNKVCQFMHNPQENHGRQ